MARKPKREITPEHHERLKTIGFQKGKSGNPAGRPVEDEALKTKMRNLSPEVIDRLFEIVQRGNNEASIVKASELILAYVMPKAATRHEHDHKVTTFADFLIRVNSEPEALETDIIEATLLPRDYDDKDGEDVD